MAAWERRPRTWLKRASAEAKSAWALLSDACVCWSLMWARLYCSSSTLMRSPCWSICCCRRAACAFLSSMGLLAADAAPRMGGRSAIPTSTPSRRRLRGVKHLLTSPSEVVGSSRVVKGGHDNKGETLTGAGCGRQLAFAHANEWLGEGGGSCATFQAWGRRASGPKRIRWGRSEFLLTQSGRRKRIERSKTSQSRGAASSAA